MATVVQRLTASRVSLQLVTCTQGVDPLTPEDNDVLPEDWVRRVSPRAIKAKDLPGGCEGLLADEQGRLAFSQVEHQLLRLGTDLQMVTANALQLAAWQLKDCLKSQLGTSEYCEQRAWLDSIVQEHLDKRKAGRAAYVETVTSKLAEGEAFDLTSDTQAASTQSSSKGAHNEASFDMIVAAFVAFEQEVAFEQQNAEACHTSSSSTSSVCSDSSNIIAASDQSSNGRNDQAASPVQNSTASAVPDFNFEGDISDHEEDVSPSEVCRKLRQLFRTVFEVALDSYAEIDLDELLTAWAQANHLRSQRNTLAAHPLSNLETAEQVLALWEQAVKARHPALEDLYPISDYTITAAKSAVNKSKSTMEQGRKGTAASKLKFKRSKQQKAVSQPQDDYLVFAA